MAASRDIQELVSKLSSDKSKTRDEGIKLLNTWMEGERSSSFFRLLGQNTARMKPNELPHSETWPFLIKLLMKCVSLEIGTCKKRPPRLIFAKTIRTAIQRAEDAKFSGKNLLLLSIVKQIFNHIGDVVRDIPIFQSEYGIILRELMVVVEYRYQIRKQVYSSLLLLYLSKVEATISGKSNSLSCTKEEVFRCIMTLHILLENPPGDFPCSLREHIVKGFIGIFSHVRDEGKISRKLMDCVNTFLLKDGPNLGCLSMEIHSALQDFVLRFWLGTHDRGLKSALIVYGKAQLTIIRSSNDGSPIIEQLLDVISKDLDQITPASVGTSWDDKAGTLVNSHRSLMELAAAVFYQACLNTREQSFEGKTLKREHAATRLKDGLVQGKFLWNGSFYFLVHNFHLRIKKHLLIYWFEGISKNFERVLNDSNSTQSYDGMLWLLQSLQELSSLLSFCAPCKGTFQQFYLTSEEILLVRSGWHVIWSCLLHGLPIFRNLTPVADSALKLLSSIISNDLINLFNVPQDVWDLRIFRHMPSSFALQFVSIYFSSKCAQGNLPEVLQLRKNLLRAVLGLLKDPGALSEPVVWLLPASIFSLCTGCAPFKPSSPSCVEDMMEWMKKEENDQSIAHQLYDCSVEILAEIATESSVEVSHTAIHHGLRLPQQMRHSLTQEMEEYFLANVILYEEVEKFNLSDLFFLCGLLSNCIYYVFLTRLGESNSSLVNKMVGHILKLLEQIVLVVEKNCVELRQHRCLDTGSVFYVEGRTLTSLRCFLCCPLFRVWVNDADNNLHTSIMHVTERLLFALTKLFSESSQCTLKVECEAPVPCLISSPSNLVENPNPVYDAKVRHVDMELDVDDDSEDMDFFTVSGNNVPGTSFSSVEWKRELVSAISFFFSVSPDATWKVLFNLIGQEDNLKVCEVILFSLCQGYSCSAGTVSDLVCLMTHMLEVSVSPRLCSVGILTAVHSLLERLLLLFPRGKDETGKKFATGVLEQSLETLGDLLNKIAEIGLPDWSARIKLLECICCFVSLDPHIAQGMIERLLGMLQDTDFRVRFFLAKRIGVLFQTWDGHDQLLQDISYNFGIQLVMASNEKLVKAGEVLDVGSNPRPFMETVLVSLAHIAFCSEKVESEVVFMMCVISAMDFRERELVKALLDDLSRKLLYANRTKYFEELMGSILARWVVCEVSLDALVEIQDHFNVTSETSCFMRSCCPWLLPTLILHKQTVNLNWVSMVIGQPISVLVKDYFVEIFSICMALLCSMKGDRENGAMVLRSYILQIAGISENQRDDLIKKHMVSIVSFLLSLSSSALDPAFPLFSKDVIVLSVRKVVDGFLEMDGHPMSFDIVDKINVFRPDRVFMFLVEIHNQITGAVHARHKCHRLSAIEVLVNVIGQRSTVPSTSSYILNLIGQFIADGALQDQCCVILTTLLEVFYKNPVKDILGVLGEQLQFLISKLVACCISSNNLSETSSIRSMKVLILLHQLTVDADPFLYSYIKELEPFPELDCFERIRTFHLELCKLYSPKEHLLKLVKRAGELPRRLLLLSLQSLHKNPLLLEIIRPVRYSENINGKADCWQSDPDIVYAIWALVGMCDSDDTEVIGALVADFISMVGIGDPHRVVFHLPCHTNERFLCPQLDNNSERGICTFIDACVSDETLIKLIKLLKKYLLDASVKTVEITSQTLRGILSTDRGHGAMLSFDSYERSLIAVHTKGVNLEVVEKLLMEFRIRSSEAGSLDDSSLWSTHGKTYEIWICSLVYSLLNHGTDIILRLCQDIVLLKAEVAELLLPNVLVDIAMGKDSKVDICQKISEKVMEYVLFDSNDMIKSVKTMLNALNELRLFYVLERVGASSVQSSQEISKKARTSSYSRMRSTSERYKDQSSPTNVGCMSCILWTKVYWLCIDYLVVAKAAIRCGLYFTAVLFVEYWCEEHFNGLTLGESDFSLHEVLPAHIELLVAAITRINEPDSIYGIIQSHKLTSQIKMYEHEGDWGKVLEYYDLLIRMMPDKPSGNCSERTRPVSILMEEKDMEQWKSCKGLMRALQNTGCTHILDVYCRGLVNQKGHFQSDSEFTELQYEAAWRAGNWDFSLLPLESNYIQTRQITKRIHFNESVHSCLRALQEGDPNEFHMKINDSKKELVVAISRSSMESTENIYSTIVKLQILHHLGLSWNLRWGHYPYRKSKNCTEFHRVSSIIPTMAQMDVLIADWSFILKQARLHLNLLEPFIAFRRVLLQILNCNECTAQHLLQSASTFRKGSRFSQAAAAVHEFKLLNAVTGQEATSYSNSLGRLEEAKILWAQGQHDMAINLARYILQNYQLDEDASNVYRLVGKWLAENRSSNSRIILEQYLKQSVKLAELNKNTNENSISRQCQMYFHLAHYTDALFKSYEERLASSEWQAAMRLRKHKTKELDALIRRVKSSTKGEKNDYSIKIQELQKQLTMDREEAKKLQDDRDSFLSLSLEGYQRCLVLGDKYDLRVVFRLLSLWFSLSSRQSVVESMLNAVKEVQSYKFVPLVYQIASRMGGPKDGQGSNNFQHALVSLVKKMACDHPYHTIFQILALANGHRVKDKQRSRSSFIVDMDKKHAAENLLNELSSYHGDIIRQMKHMVEIYIKLAELETKKEDTNKKVALPRELRSAGQLELVPVVTATFPIDRSCRYHEGTFPHFKGLSDSIMVMNGINAPKVVECLGSDGRKYRQLAKSGNDDLRQDAVMEQFFGLVNTFLLNHRDTWKRRIGIRTYKVVPFTPSAGVLEWVDRTVPLGEYLLGSTRNGGAHGRYGIGDWPFFRCREYMVNEKDKSKAFHKVCSNFRPVMHFFFLERFMHPADWFEKRLSYIRSVAASSMVGYIVGLGDRHSMNILIDETTAEVVHIDLGVAFEQGLMLKTPERVPFRLTRDVIDGMGVTGVEGVFRRCCEKTLSVMRTNKEALITIIEVFIHDPLYKWALSPLKALQRQKDIDDDMEFSLEDSQDEWEGNKDATRALLRVKQKLDGYDDGEMRSVQGQVQQLIHDATDSERLCQMFPGWGAWL